MRIVYFLIVIIILFNSCAEPLGKKDVLTKFNFVTNDINTAQYQISYLSKPYGKEDTTLLIGTCWIEKLLNDSVLGMKVKMLHQDGYSRIYDGNNYYTVDNVTLKVKVVDPVVFNVMPFKGSAWDRLVFRELINGVSFDKLKELNISYELEENPNEVLFHVLRFILPDSSEFSGYSRLWVDRETYLPQKMISEFYFQGKTQYSEISISDLIINDSQVSEVFTDFKIPDNYVVEYYSPPENGKLQLLSNDVVAPNFSLLNLDGDKVTLQELKGKMVLIDFWYTSCYPCIKAMPYIEKLHNEYADKGLVVLGVNPIDANDVDKLNQFLSKNEITYPILLANQNMVNSYFVHAYPSLYLIDKEGKIVFSEIGFDKSTVVTLDSLIGIELNN